MHFLHSFAKQKKTQLNQKTVLKTPAIIFPFIKQITMTPKKTQLLVRLMYTTVLLFYHAATRTTATNHVTSYPNYQHLNVRSTIASTKIHPSHIKPVKIRNNRFRNIISLSKNNHNDEALLLNSSNTANKGINLNLIHRDALVSKKRGHRTRLDKRLIRDVKRVKSIVRKISNVTMTGIYDYKVESFGTGVVSGMEEGSGEYFIRIGVGSPPKKQYMVIDSGSDIVWVQCEPCNECYSQSDPVFNPAGSNSYETVVCKSSVCDRLEKSMGCSHTGKCRYEVDYSDGSFSKGTLAFETVSLGGVSVRNVAIGCGHSNRGMFVGAAGLLGLGSGSMSFVGQLEGQIGGAFSYCLVSRGSGEGGSLLFGREAMPEGAAWINLVRNPRAASFYYVELSGLGVGGTKVPVSDSVFKLSESGSGGMVMDTGTAVTRLPSNAYVAFRDAFVSSTANLPRVSSVSIFDTCYDLSGFTSVRVPTVSFYFADGPVLTLPARNFLIPVDETGTFCFAFAPSPSGLSIMGNIQQEGIQISIDGANGYVGFGPNVC